MDLRIKPSMFLNLFIVALLFASGKFAQANDFDESEDQDEVTTDYVQEELDNSPVSNSQEEESTAPIRQPSSVAVSESPDFEDFLLSQEQQQPEDSLGRVLVRNAGHLGGTVDSESFLNSELNNGPVSGMNFDRLTDITFSSGFMKKGMDRHFSERIVANTNVAELFQNHSHLRSEAGVSLPSDFASLINFAEQYIRVNSLSNSEATNGLNHRSLATQVIRASFCFGNDPFMILAKMRRETNFTRSSISPTGAVGFSQMTYIGVQEVRDQLSGDGRVALPEARSAFQQAIRCFTGINNYQLPSGSTENLKTRISQKWGLDMVFGQILVKTLVSYTKTGQAYGNNSGGVVAAYEDAFVIYNGDRHMTSGICTKSASVQMREEYACDVISQFSRMSAQWNRFILRSSGKDISYMRFFDKVNLFSRGIASI